MKEQSQKVQFQKIEGKLTESEEEALVSFGLGFMVPHFSKRLKAEVDLGPRGQVEFSVPIVTRYRLPLDVQNERLRLNGRGLKTQRPGSRASHETYFRRDLGVYASSEHDAVISGPIWPYRGIKLDDPNVDSGRVFQANVLTVGEVAHRYSWNIPQLVVEPLAILEVVPLSLKDAEETKGLFYTMNPKGSPLKNLPNIRADKLYSMFQDELAEYGYRFVPQDRTHPFKDLYLYGHREDQSVKAGGWPHFEKIR